MNTMQNEKSIPELLNNIKICCNEIDGHVAKLYEYKAKFDKYNEHIQEFCKREQERIVKRRELNERMIKQTEEMCGLCDKVMKLKFV